MISTLAHTELIEFFAGMNPQAVVDFHPSEETKKRVSTLIYKQKTAGLTTEEKAELDNYVQLEHLMRMAKAQARKYLASK